jgi:hypothetical protein
LRIPEKFSKRRKEKTKPGNYKSSMWKLESGKGIGNWELGIGNWELGIRLGGLSGSSRTESTSLRSLARRMTGHIRLLFKWWTDGLCSRDVKLEIQGSPQVLEKKLVRRDFYKRGCKRGCRVGWLFSTEHFWQINRKSSVKERST